MAENILGQGSVIVYLRLYLIGCLFKAYLRLYLFKAEIKKLRYDLREKEIQTEQDRSLRLKVREMLP